MSLTVCILWNTKYIVTKIWVKKIWVKYQILKCDIVCHSNIVTLEKRLLYYIIVWQRDIIWHEDNMWHSVTFCVTRPWPPYRRQGLGAQLGLDLRCLERKKTLRHSRRDPLVQNTCRHQGVQLTSFGAKNVTSQTGGFNWPFRCLEVQCVSFAWHVIFLVEDFDETQIRLQYRNASHISASSTVTGLSSLSLLSLLVIVVVLLLWLQYWIASHISASSAATGLLALPSTVEATTFFDDLKQTDR